MNLAIEDIVLRRPEQEDVDALYHFKNDPEVAGLLGGFSLGYAKADLSSWVEYHRTKANEALWVIADSDSNACLGHVGLYDIDHRVALAEFAIMLGDKSVWGRGLGKRITHAVVQYGFEWLNLNRIELSALVSNERAIHIYHSIGFRSEGVRRQAQFKDGRYLDIQLMAILRDEFAPKV
ncbi:MAG: GNAT family N-acetyltransferase [Myxococcales bacterium]|nr:GNAT family N-acetyltransferase [Myxococcales bacterium]